MEKQKKKNNVCVIIKIRNTTAVRHAVPAELIRSPGKVNFITKLQSVVRCHGFVVACASFRQAPTLPLMKIHPRCEFPPASFV